MLYCNPIRGPPSIEGLSPMTLATHPDRAPLSPTAPPPPSAISQAAAPAPPTQIALRPATACSPVSRSLSPCSTLYSTSVALVQHFVQHRLRLPERLPLGFPYSPLRGVWENGRAAAKPGIPPPPPLSAHRNMPGGGSNLH